MGKRYPLGTRDRGRGKLGSWRFEVQLDGREVADFRRVERHIEEKGLWDWRVSGPRSGSATKRKATKR